MSHSGLGHIQLLQQEEAVRREDALRWRMYKMHWRFFLGPVTPASNRFSTILRWHVQKHMNGLQSSHTGTTSQACWLVVGQRIARSDNPASIKRISTCQIR